MTGKERMLAALSGEKPDRVPFAPNIWQWYHANDYSGTLAPQAQAAGSPLATLRALGADIFSKFDSYGYSRGLLWPNQPSNNSSI